VSNYQLNINIFLSGINGCFNPNFTVKLPMDKLRFLMYNGLSEHNQVYLVDWVFLSSKEGCTDGIRLLSYSRPNLFFGTN